MVSADVYGIRNKDKILCHGNVFIFDLLPVSQAVDMVVRESAYDIDILCQNVATEWGQYDLYVFKISEDQEAQMIMNKLRGKNY